MQGSPKKGSFGHGAGFALSRAGLWTLRSICRYSQCRGCWLRDRTLPDEMQPMQVIYSMGEMP
jgi:hypothetical protein